MWGHLSKATNTLQELIQDIPELMKLRGSIFRHKSMDYHLFKLTSTRLSACDDTKLFQLVSTGREFEASDDRDHVYASLGMANSESTTLNPDCAQPVAEVYQDFTWRLILSSPYGQNLDVLGDAGSTGARIDFGPET